MRFPVATDTVAAAVPTTPAPDPDPAFYLFPSQITILVEAALAELLLFLTASVVVAFLLSPPSPLPLSPPLAGDMLIRYVVATFIS